jgi:hypothetical protein
MVKVNVTPGLERCTMAKGAMKQILGNQLINHSIEVAIITTVAEVTISEVKVEVAGDPKGLSTTPGNHQRNDLTHQLQMHPNLMDIYCNRCNNYGHKQV